MDKDGRLLSIAEEFGHRAQERLQELTPAQVKSLGGVYRFVLGGQCWFVLEVGAPTQFHSRPPLPEAGPPRAQIALDEDTLTRLLEGKLGARAAFFAGKVRILGDVLGFVKVVGHVRKAAPTGLPPFQGRTAPHR